MTQPLHDAPALTVLKLERRGCALVATIDDPDTRNAMSEALLADFDMLFHRYESDTDVRVLVLRGNDRVFCAGANLRSGTLVETQSDPRKTAIALSERGARIFGGVNAFPKPVIAVVEGAAMGGGLGLTACADIVLATPGARFALSEARLGLVAAQIAPFVVGRIGLSVTRRLALTGQSVVAADALRFGLVDELLPDREALELRLDAILSEIQLCAPGALKATKLLLQTLAGFDSENFKKRAASVFADAVLGEGAEGIAAFKEKRAPAWANSK